MYKAYKNSGVAMPGDTTVFVGFVHGYCFGLTRLRRSKMNIYLR